jgi:SRSO17 transposase
MLEGPETAPVGSGTLVIDETGDRKDGKATAHVGHQYLGGIGKIANGVVSVSSVYADERLYYPLEVQPYTPSHHFEGGKADSAFRTKPQIALELVDRAVQMGIPFRAVVADILYGEHREFRRGLEERHIPYVLAVKPSYGWYSPTGGGRQTGRELARGLAGTGRILRESGWPSDAPFATGTPRGGGRSSPRAGHSKQGDEGGW